MRAALGLMPLLGSARMKVVSPASREAILARRNVPPYCSRHVTVESVITPEVGLESLIDPDDAYSLDLEIDDSMIAALAAAESEPMQEDIPAEGDKKPE